MKYYIVVGRVMFDEEDTLDVFLCSSPKEAVEQAEKKLRDEVEAPDAEVLITYLVDCGHTEPRLLESIL